MYQDEEIKEFSLVLMAAYMEAQLESYMLNYNRIALTQCIKDVFFPLLIKLFLYNKLIINLNLTKRWTNIRGKCNPSGGFTSNSRFELKPVWKLQKNLFQDDKIHQKYTNR